MKAEIAFLEDSVYHAIINKDCGDIIEYVKSVEGSLSLMKLKLLQNIYSKDGTLDLNDDVIAWLLSDITALKTLLMSGEVAGDLWQKSMKVIVEIIGQDPGAKKGLKLRLAAATALTFVNDVSVVGEYSTSPIDGITRYHNFVKWFEEGVLFEPFSGLSAWHLRYVVGAWFDDNDLVWARENVLPEFRCPSKIADVTHDMVPYRSENADGVSVQEGAPFYYNKQITMSLLHEMGGVCGAISKYAATMSQAFGIPAMPVAQPGHCAYAWYRDKEWALGNEVSTWNCSTTHDGIQFPWKRPAPFFNLMDSAQNNFEVFCVSENIRSAATFTSPNKRLHLLDSATSSCPVNYSLWTDLMECLQDPELAKTTVQNVFGRILQNLREDNLKPRIISREKPVTVSSFSERASNLVEVSGSEWWTDEKSAWFEIDFMTSCSIKDIHIQWWGRSKANHYVIFAMGGDGTFIKVKSEADEHVDGDFNHWSRISGWEMKTSKIRIELEDGCLDPWDFGYWFGIRQVNVFGREIDDIIDISTGKHVTANCESTGSEGLVCEDIVEWEANADNSWLEIQLDDICMLDSIDIVWMEDGQPDEVKITYRLGSNDPVLIESSALSGVGNVVRVDQTGRRVSIRSVKVFGTPYKVRDIFEMNVRSKLHDHWFIVKDVVNILGDCNLYF